MAGFQTRNKLLEDLLDISGTGRLFRVIDNSNGYEGSLDQTGLAVGSTTHFLVKTGATELVLEGLRTVTDFSLVTDGRMLIQLSMYVDISDINTWSTGNGTDLPLGRNLNCADINKLPLSTIAIDPPTVSVAGTADFQLQFAEYFIDTQGNRENLATNSATFFEGGARLLLPANSEFLFISQVTGDATGTASNRSIFFTSEIPPEV